MPVLVRFLELAYDHVTLAHSFTLKLDFLKITSLTPMRGASMFLLEL